MISFANDRFMDGEPTVSVNDLGFGRGYAIFDFFRTVEGHCLYMDEHLNRFAKSAEGLQLTPPYSMVQIARIVREVVSKNGFPSSGVKLYLTGGNSEDGYTPTTSNFYITETPFPIKTPNLQGIRLITQPYLRSFPLIKSTHYLQGIQLLPAIINAGAQDVLYLNNEWVTELPRANIFMVSMQGTIITPKNNVLPGITRKHILAMNTRELPVMEQDFKIGALMSASEVFITSTSRSVHSVTHINHQRIGDAVPGPVASQILAQLQALETKFLGNN